MYTVYVLQDDFGKRYTGYTGRIELRLNQHNSSRTFTTSKGKNWKLIYKEEYEDKSQAIKRERFLKTGHGRDFLKTQSMPGRLMVGQGTLDP